jgi:hypothetical protein
MTARLHISLKTKLASALLALGHIEYSHAKLMTAEMIVSLYHFDHGILHAHGGADEPWNLTPRLIAPHRVKTAKVDVPVAAKVKRLSAKQEETRRRILARPCGQKRKPVSRLRSKGFDTSKSRKFSGKIIPRERQ